MLILGLGTPPELRFLVGDGERRRWVGDVERLDGDLVRLLGDGERSCLVGDDERSLVGDGERFDGDVERLVRVDCCIDCGCCWP